MENGTRVIWEMGGGGAAGKKDLLSPQPPRFFRFARSLRITTLTPGDRLTHTSLRIKAVSPRMECYFIELSVAPFC